MSHGSSKNEPDNQEDIDIDLEDPETEKAALKIQAQFKGFKARQEVKALKQVTIKRRLKYISIFL